MSHTGEPYDLDDDGPLYADEIIVGLVDVLLPGDDEPPERQVTLADMHGTGASYRQLDFWARKGWLNPTQERDGHGSGYARQWSPRDLHVAHLMVRLIRSGVATGHAARIAADAVDHGVRSVTTEEGVTVSWKPVSPWKDPIAPDLGDDPDGDQDEQVMILLAQRQRTPHPFDPNPEDEFCAWCAGPRDIEAHGADA